MEMWRPFVAHAAEINIPADALTPSRRKAKRLSVLVLSARFTVRIVRTRRGAARRAEPESELK